MMTNKIRPVEITKGVTIGSGKLTLISGPCQIESRDHCLKIAAFLNKLTKTLPIQLIFKSSFDKANRLSLKSQRGIGLHEGLEILAIVRRESGLPVLTDVHEASQVGAVAEAVDVLQIPAFLCRQTDLLVAAGKTGKAINIKKGQFLPPEDMRFSAEKVTSTGNNRVLLCERGSCFGYRDLVVDMRSLPIMRRLGFPIIFDGTHSVQQMGGAGGSSGGAREFIPELVRAAVAVGVDGLFLECHDDPARAPSDGTTMLRLEEVEPILKAACAIFEAHKTL